MKTRHIICAGLVLIGSIEVGCRQNQPAQTAKVLPSTRPVAVAAAPAPATRPAEDRPTISDPPVNTADALAQTADKYARNMEAALNQQKLKAHAQPPAMADASDQVQWEKPTAGHDREVTSPATHPTDPSQVSANSGMSQPVKNRTEVTSSNPVHESQQPSDRAQTASANTPPREVTRIVPDDTAARIAQRAKDYPQDVAAQLDNQLMEFAYGKIVPNMDQLNGLPTDDREMISALMDGLTNFRSALRSDNNMLLSRKVRPLLDMSDRLSSQAELSIPKFVLCSRAPGFGDYMEMSSRFAGTQEHNTGIYCEIQNFSSQQTSSNMWESKLRMNLVLYTDQGLEAWTPDAKGGTLVHDLSHSRRHDFFVARALTLPSSLPIGRYILKVTFTDLQANRVAENSIPIEVVAQ